MTGTTSYTIDAYTASTAGSIVFTVDDRSQANVAVEYKGAATNWETVPMYDDGTNGDATAGDNVWSVTIENILQELMSGARSKMTAQSMGFG